jgi:hypothetical protein
LYNILQLDRERWSIPAPVAFAALPDPEEDQHQEGEAQHEELYEDGPVEAVQLVGVSARGGAHVRSCAVTYANSCFSSDFEFFTIFAFNMFKY